MKGRDALSEAAAGCRAGQLALERIGPLAEALLDPAIPDDHRSEFLSAYVDKGETPEELATWAKAFLPHAVDPGLHGTWNGQRIFDCCGTGGGGLNILNISTAMVFVLAAAGVPVVKHGNRGMTKRSGSADVLEALGIRIDHEPEGLRRSLEMAGCAFIFAPKYHPAFKTVGAVRRALGAEGKRTVFNLLGPLINPARPGAQLTGVFRKEHVDLFHHALGILDDRRHLVVCGEDADSRPLGEVSILGTNLWKGNVVPDFFVEIIKGDVAALQVESAADSARRILGILKGEGDPLATSFIEANSAVALLVQGKVATYTAGLDLAREMIRTGAALARLEAWRKV